MNCPSCGTTLTYLQFSASTSGSEWGTESFPIGDGNRNYDDSETSDSYQYEYSCPECDRNFSEQEIEQLNGQYIRENPPRQQNQQGYRPYQGTQIQEPNDGTIALDCPNCNHSYRDEPAHEMICPRCEKEWTPSEELIKTIKVTRTEEEQPVPITRAINSSRNPPNYNYIRALYDSNSSSS